MKIMIEFDPTTATVKVTRPTSVEGEALTQAVAEPAVEGAALDAGAWGGLGSGESTSAVPPQAISAGIAITTGSALPEPHLDTFSLLSGVGQSEDVLNAGFPKS